MFCLSVRILIQLLRLLSVLRQSSRRNCLLRILLRGYLQ